MGKCRDCIHHDVCKDFIDTAFDGFLDEGEEILYDDNNMNGDDCKFYACKSRYQIHLYSYNLNVESEPFVYGDFVVFYHEERLYSVRHRETDVVALVFANNPNDAIMRVKGALKECKKDE